MVPRYADALRGLRGIWLDAGTRDDWFLDLGAEAVRRELAVIGVDDVRFELFEATHAGIDYRYPRGLAYLAERLAALSVSCWGSCAAAARAGTARRRAATR